MPEPGHLTFVTEPADGRKAQAEKLVGRPGATTPWPEKPEEQQEAEEELLQRFVDLNHQRAAEEAQGKIRWLRPEYQAPEETTTQGQLDTGTADATPDQTTKKPINQPNWPDPKPCKHRSEPSATSSPPPPWTPRPSPPSSNANPKSPSPRSSTHWPSWEW